ncbi:MAG: restriction endonuclease, partial [Candidatus Aenigmarchaeota archaeon]|nr:restriction endonuclease [Candidatus Aenigmarchaeota archaeon]
FNKFIKPEELENFLAKKDWRFFENFVREIFELHGFRTKIHIRVGPKNGKKEIDILAYNNFLAFLVECKRWWRGRYKNYALKKEAQKHLERVRLLSSYSFIVRKRKVVGIIVTLLDEQIKKENSIYFVPLWRLNTFLLHCYEIV